MRSIDTVDRRTLFISHARPESDDITRWLSGRLTARGYRVWADLEQLHGGDEFWADIERTIRTECVRFIILVSRTAITRKGVLDELAEACDVARRLKEDRFIIPLKADDLPWDEFPIQIKRLNGLDFSSDWSSGLTQLLETLEVANVPRSEGDPEVGRVAELLSTSRNRIHERAEPALLNWLPITCLPQEIRYFHTSYSAADLGAARGQISIPHAPRDRLLLSFADEASVRAAVPQQMEVELRYRMGLPEFLSGKPENGPRMKPSDAQNLLSDVLRQAFENELRHKGLVQFDHRWFVPEGWRPDNKGRYAKNAADEGYRVLVGKSKELTWHLAISVFVYIAEPVRLQLMPHVLFSPDGITPLADQKSLRRTRCKLWWNDKWRDLLLALLAELWGKDAHSANVSLGGNSSMTVATRPVLLELAASYSDEEAFVPDADDDPEWGDGDDDGMEVIA